MQVFSQKSRNSQTEFRLFVAVRFYGIRFETVYKNRKINATLPKKTII
jgi:hypothetical protein